MPVLSGRTLAELREGDQADLFVVVEGRAAPVSPGGPAVEGRIPPAPATAPAATVALEVSDRSARAIVRIAPGDKAFEPARRVAAGDVVKLRAVVERAGNPLELRGLALRPVEAQDGSEVHALAGGLPPEAQPVASGTVAFDVETTPRLAVAELPERERVKVVRWAVEDARRETGLEAPGDDDVEESLRKALALNPLTSRVVSIAFAAVETGAELALVDAGEEPAEPLPPGTLVLAERSILATFWAVARRAGTLVGFNSRRFDVPVLLTRSALLGVRASVDLLAPTSGREAGARHVDLAHVFSARGASSDRRLSLELAAFAFGIPAKTEAHGSEVGRLVEEERFGELAGYNLEDARATAELYRRLRGTWL